MGMLESFRRRNQEAAKEAIKPPEGVEQAPESEKEARSRALHERVGSAEQRISSMTVRTDSSRREIEAVSEFLDKIDPEWKQGSDPFNRDSGVEMPGAAKSLREKYDQHGEAFDSAFSQLGDANKEHAVAMNQVEAFDKHGVDLEVKGKEIEARKKELEQLLRQSDELTEGSGIGTRPKLEEYLALDAESQAIASGTWENNKSWLPKEADVPDFMPKFKETQTNAGTGKYETSSKLVENEIRSEEARKASEESNIRAGRAPEAF